MVSEVTPRPVKLVLCVHCWPQNTLGAGRQRWTTTAGDLLQTLTQSITRISGESHVWLTPQHDMVLPTKNLPVRQTTMSRLLPLRM